MLSDVSEVEGGCFLNTQEHSGNTQVFNCRRWSDSTSAQEILCILVQ